MEETYIRGKIRKITIGTNPIDAIAAPIGLTIKDFKVVEIVHDKNYLEQFGREKFLVIAENKEKVRFVWKEAVDVPCLLEYYDPKEMPEDHI